MAVDPASAGIEAGAGFLQNYLAQQAAREKEKRDAKMNALRMQSEQEQSAIANQGQQTQGALSQLMNTYGRVFT